LDRYSFAYELEDTTNIPGNHEMKKTSLLLIIPMFFMFMQCRQFSGPDPVDRLASKIAKDLSKKYHLSPCAIGGEAKEGKSSQVIVDFQFEGDALDITEGRKLIVSLAQDFLIEFNKQVDPQDVYLYPFKTKDIDLGIYCRSKSGQIFMDPFVKTLVSSGNEIGFFTQDPNNLYKMKQKIYEPFEEAVEKVKQSNQELP